MAKRKLPTGFSEWGTGYRLRFTHDGKRYAVYGSTIKECKERELLKLQELEQKKYHSSKSLTVSEYFDRWIDSREDVITSQTIRTYKKLLNRIRQTVIDDTGREFGDLKLVKVEPDNVRALMKALQKECVIKDKNGNECKRKALTTRSTNDSMFLVKKIFRNAVNERVIVWSPAECIEPLKRKEEPIRNNLHRALTKEETKVFFDNVGDSYYGPLYKFLLFTGCRIGEAGAITLKDIVGDKVNINKTVIRTEAGYEIGNETKTQAGTRSVPLRPEAKAALDRQARINAALHDQSVTHIDKPVFRAPKGGLIRPDRVNDDLAAICKKAGLERFTAHAFRDTFITRCTDSGAVSVKSLMETVGHSDVQMTLGLYSHGNDHDKKEQLSVVNFM